VATERERES
jgi:hypothetical protein